MVGRGGGGEEGGYVVMRIRFHFSLKRDTCHNTLDYKQSFLFYLCDGFFRKGGIGRSQILGVQQYRVSVW